MLLGLLLAPLLASGTSCPVFNCSSSAATSGQCITYTNTTGVDNYLVTPCVAGLYCGFESKASSTCKYPTDYMPRYPGEYCFDALDCHSGTCLNGKCSGISSGNPCNMTYECNPKLYCDSISDKCEALLNIGNACTDTSQCSNSVCDSLVCTAYFSKANGQPATEISPQGLAWACKTGFAKGGLCAAPPVSPPTKVVTNCTAGEVCKDQNGVSNKTCTCSYNGKAYCPLFEGDTQVQAMITGIQTILPYNINCHTLNRFSYECFVASANTTITSDYVTWAANAQLYLNNQWVLQHTSQICVNETLQASYLNIVNQSEGKIQQCPVYTETNYTEGWTANMCIFATDDIYYSNLMTTFQAKPSVCGTSQYCNAIVTTAATSSYCTPIAVRYPGDNCTVGTQCSSNNCTNNICTGAAFNQTCRVLSDCNPGYYCNTTGSVCIAAVPQGGVCSSSLYCQANLTCNLGICIPFYSVKLNGPVEAVSGEHGFSLACTTGFAVYNSTTKNTTCKTAPKSKSVNAKCTPGQLCKDSSGVYSKMCQCGTNGVAYCPTFEGDSAATKMISYHKKIIAYQSNCNTVVIDQWCYNKSSTIYKYYNNYVAYQNEYENAPLLVDSRDSFIGNLYFSVYWAAYDQIDHSSSFGASLALSIVSFVAFNI